MLHDGSQALVIDPGDSAPVLAALTEWQLVLSGILVTHHHGDHVAGRMDLGRRQPRHHVRGTGVDRAHARLQPFGQLRGIEPQAEDEARERLQQVARGVERDDAPRHEVEGVGQDANLVVRFDDSGISVRAYRCRKWKSVTWAQLASLADDTEPVVRFCETDHGSRVLEAMGVRLPKDDQSARGGPA